MVYVVVKVVYVKARRIRRDYAQEFKRGKTGDRLLLLLELDGGRRSGVPAAAIAGSDPKAGRSDGCRIQVRIL